MRIHRARNSQKLCTTRLRSFRDASFNHSLWTLILTEPTVMQRFCISQLCAIDCQETKSEFLSWWNAAIQLAGTERWWWLTLSARVSERLGWRDSKHFVNSHATSHVYLFNVLKWMYRGGWLIGKTTVPTGQYLSKKWSELQCRLPIVSWRLVDPAKPRYQPVNICPQSLMHVSWRLVDRQNYGTNFSTFVHKVIRAWWELRSSFTFDNTFCKGSRTLIRA